MRRRLWIVERAGLVVTVAANVIGIALPAWGQDSAPQTQPGDGGAIATQAEPPPGGEADRILTDEERAEIDRLNDQASEQFGAGNFSEALAGWRGVLEIDPTDSTAMYNAACAQAALGHPNRAIDLLRVAIASGFVDFAALKRDKDLDSLRENPRFIELLKSIDAAYAAAADHMEEWSRQTLGPKAKIERDEARHIVYATCLDEVGYASMRATLDKQMAWQIAHLFDGPPDSFILLLVPTPEQADRIIQSVRVGGFYDHQKRRLVTREIGPSLRHEITHALHHAQLDRLGQNHPMWVQEGLASVFELYQIDENDRLMVRDNTRLNIAINLRKTGGLSDWPEFFQEDDRHFTGERPRAKYAEARAVFQFLAEKGMLEKWYRAYLDSYSEDATGAKAFEIVFEKSLDEVQREYRKWLGSKEKVPEKIYASAPSIGVWVADQGANDGVKVVGIVPGGAAETYPVREGDVIIAINDEPMFAVEEVIDWVSRRAEGDVAKLRIRRAGTYKDVSIPMRPVRQLRHQPEVIQEPGAAV